MAKQRRRGAVVSAVVTLALIGAACGKGDQATTVDAVTPEEAKALMFRGVDKTAGTTSVQFIFTSVVHLRGDSIPSVLSDPKCTAAPDGQEVTSYGGVDNSTGVAVMGPSRGVVHAVYPALGNPQSNTLYVARDVIPNEWRVTKPWVSVEQSDLFPTGLLTSTGLSSRPAFRTSTSRSTSERFEPADLLQDMRDAARSVTSAHDDEVDGVPTRHLRIELDTEKLPGLPKDGSTTTTGPEEAQPGPASAEVWVDADDRVRRLSLSRSLTLYADGGSMGSVPTFPGGETPASLMPIGIDFSADVRFFAYDEPLPMAVPAADQVQDLGDLPASVVLDERCGAGSRWPSPLDVPGTSAAERQAYHDCVAAETRKRTEGVSWREYRARHFPDGVLTASTTDTAACPLPAPNIRPVAEQLAEQLGPAFGIPMDSPEGKACLDAMTQSLDLSGDVGSTTTASSPLPPGTPPPACEKFFVSAGPDGPMGTALPMMPSTTTSAP